MNNNTFRALHVLLYLLTLFVGKNVEWFDLSWVLGVLIPLILRDSTEYSRLNYDEPSI